MQPVLVAGQQTGEAPDIRAIDLAVQECLEGLDLEHAIGQSKIRQIADGEPAQGTEKARDPNPEQFSQQCDDPPLVATMTMKLDRPIAIGAHRFGDDLSIGLLPFVLFRSPGRKIDSLHPDIMPGHVANGSSIHRQPRLVSFTIFSVSSSSPPVAVRRKPTPDSWINVTVHTNAIESLFSRVRSCEKNIKRYRGSRMAQRWLASVLLYAEKSFRTVKGHEDIKAVLSNIEAEHATITAS
jgi:hypothetical protein